VRAVLVPNCFGFEQSGHFGTNAEESWYWSGLGPKCP